MQSQEKVAGTGYVRGDESNHTVFGSDAEDYERVRPSYPDASVSWMVGTRPARVIDLGAGTGKLTEKLIAAGHEVLAVEPDGGMRETLAARNPKAAVLAGSAEHIPVSGGSVDVVLAAQAYHWFDKAVAHAEIRRVLKPGGVFAPVWNLRDEAVPWAFELTTVERHTHHVQMAPPVLPRNFGPVELGMFRHSLTMAPEDIVELAHSCAFYKACSPQVQGEIDGGIRELCRSHPELEGRDRIEVPYLTIAYRAARLS